MDGPEKLDRLETMYRSARKKLNKKIYKTLT